MEFVAGLGCDLSGIEEFFTGRFKSVLGFLDQGLLMLKLLRDFRKARSNLGAFAFPGL